MCFIFLDQKKRHIYATPLRSSYLAWLHYKEPYETDLEHNELWKWGLHIMIVVARMF